MPLPGHASFVVNPLTTRVPTGADRAATSRKRHPNSGCSIKRPACRVPHAMEPPSPYHLRSARRALPARQPRPHPTDWRARCCTAREPEGTPTPGMTCRVRGSTRSSPRSVLVATPPTATSGLGYSHGQPFDTVLRGYASAGRRLRRQVERRDHPAEGGSRRGPTPAPPGHRARRGHRARARELRELQGKSATRPIAVEDTFGYRAEKLLRMADQEARTCGPARPATPRQWRPLRCGGRRSSFAPPRRRRRRSAPAAARRPQADRSRFPRRRRG